MKHWSRLTSRRWAVLLGHAESLPPWPGVNKLKEIRAEIDVIGHVQGVGYRFFVIHSARTLGLRGYAKNMPNGTVKVEVEGERGIIEELMKQLKVGPRTAHVKDLRIKWSAFRGDLGDFEIRF